MTSRKQRIIATVALLLFATGAAAQFFGVPRRVFSFIVTSTLEVEGASDLQGNISSSTGFVTVADTFRLLQNQAILRLHDSVATADEGVWDIQSNADELQIVTLTDAGGAGNDAITIARTGTTVDTINLQATNVQANGNNITGSLTGFKASDESVTSSTTLQNDDDLVVAVQANTTYIVEMYVSIFNTSSVPDYKFGFTLPAGADGTYNYTALNDNSATVAGQQNQEDYLNLANNFPVAGNVGIGLDFTGMLIVAGTAGNFQLQWAQNVSDAAATTVQAGSWIRLTPL